MIHMLFVVVVVVAQPQVTGPEGDLRQGPFAQQGEQATRAKMLQRWKTNRPLFSSVGFAGRGTLQDTQGPDGKAKQSYSMLVE